jgi:uncharacterized membrane protein YhaH (DUF805 family)
MPFPFSFTGRMRPLPYALWSAGVFFSQYLIAEYLFSLQAPPTSLAQSWWFYVMPLPSLARQTINSGTILTAMVLMFALACMVIAGWVLTALAFRRAADADISGWIAAWALAPLVQIPVMLALCLIPSRPARRDPASGPEDIGGGEWAAAAQGVLAGIGLIVLAVAVGALVFGSYGYAMFLVSPFIIGATTAYLANRTRDVGGSRTLQLTFIALMLGGIALIVSALEGIVCLVLASPLAIGLALLGGLLGRGIAVYSRRSSQQAALGLALIPLMFAAESALPPAVHFETQSTIEINAAPDAVWAALVHTDLADAPVPLLFRLGVAYPLRGEMLGEGVGAIRRGVFSTGTADERVTEWAPGHKLAFVMMNQVPAMRELSPYAHVHAPHVNGYFSTTYTSFELLPRADGGTAVVERTRHELRLEPVLYWLPLARWVVNENNARVLAHVKRNAEGRTKQIGVPERTDATAHAGKKG